LRRYLLDTNNLSDLVKNPHGRVFNRIRDAGEEAICTSIIVAAELRFGAVKKGSDRLSAQVEAILSAIDVYPFDMPADAAYAELRAQLDAAGTPTCGNDMLIAAHALATDCIVVTANEDEFRRVENLQVVNWLMQS
jgi:tRNA(fMet)-specific endonuclease VapC